MILFISNFAFRKLPIVASLAQSFFYVLWSAVFYVLWSAVQIPITALCLSTCKAGNKNADSAWLKSVYAEAEEIMKSVCVTACRLIGDAT